MKRRTLAVLVTALAVAGTAAALPARAERADFVRAESFRLLNEGVAAYNKGEYAAAVEALEKCAAWALSSFRAHYYLGLALMGERHYDEAIVALRLALDLDPSHLQAHVSLGDALLLQGDTNEAMAEFFRALKLRPEYPAGLDGIARVYEATGEIDQSIQFFMRAIESNRGYAEAYTNLGDLYLRENRLDEAVRLLEEAIDIRPDFAPGLNRLSLGYARLGLHNEAVATIEKAISLQPGSPDHRSTLGHIELEMDLDASAQQSFEEALAIDELHPEARAGMAEVYRRRSEYHLAKAEIRKALTDKHLPARTRARLQERLAALEIEQARAFELWDLAFWNLATPEQYRELASLYAARRDWDRAAELQAKSEPEGAELERLAFMLFEGGRFRESQQIYSELASIDPRADLEVNNGVTLAMLGDDGGAVEAYRRALALRSDMLPAQLYLGNALLRLGRTDEAVEAYVGFLTGGAGGDDAERVRRILAKIAPESLPDDRRRQPPEPEPPTLSDSEAPEESAS